MEGRTGGRKGGADGREGPSEARQPASIIIITNT